ncbi:hypothetical protein JQ634_00975 [Bradyrhizobium sp. AUGA SZCCT0240]|uniref:hypothetical protein n=1 Tax=Bradyrhizobium sp. AUGA SZCCT0240 TaxID=2807669 RepID=UPI001BA7D1FE|nr:hypothetical protein [Bradyrhizobium sp. AUGA SZCCT0240]MBR1252270.1 hypothetical protein [Bradyrhizobium sp. AUGA SZCCT0240]
MTANILIGLGTAVFVLALLEILLSEEQKRSLANGVVQIWNILDDIKARSYLDWLRHGRSVPRMFFVLAICLLSAFFLVIASANTEELGYRVLIAGMLLASPFILLTAKFVISRLFVPAGAFETIVRIILMALILCLPGWLGLSISEAANPFIRVVAAALALYTFGMLLIWFVAAAPLVFSYVLMALLGTSEFVVRRIAEYPKGPLLAVSGLIAAVAAFTKAITY